MHDDDDEDDDNKDDEEKDDDDEDDNEPDNSDDLQLYVLFTVRLDHRDLFCAIIMPFMIKSSCDAIFCFYEDWVEEEEESPTGGSGYR